MSANEVAVLYIDYGNRASVPKTKLGSLPAAFTGTGGYAKLYSLALVSLPQDEELAAQGVSVLREDILDKTVKLNVEYKVGSDTYVSVHIEKEDVGKNLVEDGLLLVERQRGRKLEKLVKGYEEAMGNAKKNHLNIWRCGDITQDDSREFGGLGPLRPPRICRLSPTLSKSEVDSRFKILSLAEREDKFKNMMREDKLKNMILKRQKRGERKPKNVLSEFQSDDPPGRMDYDVDSVLQELGEATETEKKEKRKTKKNKAKKRKIDGKRQQHCIEEEVDKDQEVINHDTDQIISDLSGMNDIEVESEEMDDSKRGEMKSQRENELRSRQMSMEANLQELLNKHMSELDSKVTEMSQLIFKLDGAEEEKAKIEKQVLQIDADVRELQDRREKLISRTTDNDKKVAKIKEKKDKLEKYIDKIRGNWEKAKAQLEHEMEEIKIEIMNLRKVEEFSKVERVEPESDKRRNLRKLESKIEAKEKDLECSVCLEVASVPIFCCGAQHVICDSCRPKVTL